MLKAQIHYSVLDGEGKSKRVVENHPHGFEFNTKSELTGHLIKRSENLEKQGIKDWKIVYPHDKEYVQEEKKPLTFSELREAKENEVNRYKKIFANHKHIPEKHINASIEFGLKHGQSHEERTAVMRWAVNDRVKPHNDEDAPLVNHLLGGYRKATKQKLWTKEKDGDLTHYSFDDVHAKLSQMIPSHFEQKQVRNSAIKELSPYKIGSVPHPKYGSLDVYHIRKKTSTPEELEHFRLNLKKCLPSNTTYCIAKNEYGKEHFDHYSHGTGFFVYHSPKTNQVHFSHGFGDRGIVNSGNLVNDDDDKHLKIYTQHLLSKHPDKKLHDAYAFFHSGAKLSDSYEHQKAMFDEFGDKHGAAHFLDKNVPTHPKLISHIISNTTDNSIYKTALRHPNIEPHHIDKALDNYVPSIREAAIQNPNVQPHHIDKALDDNDPDVRLAAIEHPNVQPHHIDKALDYRDPYVRLAAIEHPNVQPHHIDKALDYNDPDLRYIAIQHPNVQPHHIDKALNDSYAHIRWAAATHPKSNLEQKIKYKETRKQSGNLQEGSLSFKRQLRKKLSGQSVKSGIKKLLNRRNNIEQQKNKSSFKGMKSKDPNDWNTLISKSLGSFEHVMTKQLNRLHENKDLLADYKLKDPIKFLYLMLLNGETGPEARAKLFNIKHAMTRTSNVKTKKQLMDLLVHLIDKVSTDPILYQRYRHLSKRPIHEMIDYVQTKIIESTDNEDLKNLLIESGFVTEYQLYRLSQNDTTALEDIMEPLIEDCTIANSIGSGNIAGINPGEEPPVPPRKAKKWKKRNTSS
jgi:hypothetical protein